MITYKKRFNNFIEGLNLENYRFKKNPKVSVFWENLRTKKSKRIIYRPAPLMAGVVYRQINNSKFEFWWVDFFTNMFKQREDKQIMLEKSFNRRLNINNFGTYTQFKGFNGYYKRFYSTKTTYKRKNLAINSTFWNQKVFKNFLKSQLFFNKNVLERYDYISLKFFLYYIIDQLGPYISEIKVYKKQVNIYIKSDLGRKNINHILNIFHNHIPLSFKQLVELTAVDYPARKNRFDVFYFLLSHKYKHRINIIIEAGEYSPVQTVSNIYSSANWLEREVWDMFGIFFLSHPSLRRILTDYGFEGFPLRKDFPLTGYVDIHYDLEQKRIVYEPLELAQEFRYFDFLSPWERTKIIY